MHANALVDEQACLSTQGKGLASVGGFLSYSYTFSDPSLPAFLGHAPELCYNSNYNGFDSLKSIVRRAAVTETSKF